MTESIFKKLEQENLLDWGIILLAWKETLENHPIDRLSLTDDIAYFAIKEIEKKEKYISPNLIELYSAGLLSKEEVTLYLEDICEEEKIDLKLSYRRWRLIIIEIKLEHLNKNNYYSDYIDGLDVLRDIWLTWDVLEDSQYTNIVSNNACYNERYEKLLKAYKSWIEKEKQKVC